MATLREKIGYGFGDMSSSMFWKVFSFYLPIFYSDIFGLSATDAGFLVLITRFWDAISDPMMGIIADRTHTRWGKYRPYLLWMAAPFAIVGVLVFTTPDMSTTGKLIWAYISYILMMTVYTAINVPYGAMLGAMTDDSSEKTVFSSFRMSFAYGGSLIALGAWEPLCNLFVSDNIPAGKTPYDVSPDAWQYAMICIASICFIGFLLCFFLTREHLECKTSKSAGKDLKSLIHNKPWWILNGAALLSNCFNTVRGATATYFFKYYIAPGASLDFGFASVLLYAGLFLTLGEVCNMLSVPLAVPFSKKFGKKTTYTFSLIFMVVFSILFFYVPNNMTGWWLMLVLQVLISVCTGIISPLVWSMYADVADYAEQRDGLSSTGLIFSSGSMAQKFGCAFAGWAVLELLGFFGYDKDLTEQAPIVIEVMKYLMSYIPAVLAALSLLVIFIYPLDTKRMAEISADLKRKRA